MRGGVVCLGLVGMMLSYVPVNTFVTVLVGLCEVASFRGMAYLCGLLMICMCVVGYGVDGGMANLCQFVYVTRL